MPSLHSLLRFGLRARTPRTFLLNATIACCPGLCLNPSLLADSPKRFERFSTRDGLSHNWVKCILQDQSGFLWVGTQDGLNRFDAYVFKTYAFDARDPNSLTNSSINFLLDDPSGDLWVGTAGGLERYRRERDGFEPVAALPSHDALAACPAPGGLWVGTNRGLYRYHQETDTATAYLPDEADPKSLPHPSCQALLTDSRGYLWAGTGAGLSRLDPQTGAFQHIRFDGGSALSGRSVTALLEDPQGRLWVGANRGGLFVSSNAIANPENARFQQVLEGDIASLAIDGAQQLWIGHRSNGGLDLIDLETYSAAGSLQASIKTAAHDPYSLPGNAIHSLYQDRNGDMWVGTYGRGLGFHTHRGKAFHVERARSENPNTLPNNTVNALLEDGPRLWVGTNGGLAWLHRASGDWKPFPVDADDPASPGASGIFALHRDSKGSVWVGGWGIGLRRYHPDTDTFHAFRSGAPPGESVNNDNVYALQDDGRGSLWIGTLGGGLNSYHYATGRFSYYTEDDPVAVPLNGNNVNKILLSRDDALWISTYNGLNRFDFPSETFAAFPRERYRGDGMANADLLDLFEDSRGALWLGTESGLVRFDPASEQFKRYDQTTGLLQNTINAIEEDSQGNLWLSTNQGLVRFHRGIDIPAEPQFRLYTVEDGLPGNQFMPRSSLAADDGRLYFGGTSGLTHFLPEEIKNNPIAPPVVLTDLLVFNRPIHPDHPDSPIEAAIDTLDSLTLNRDQSVITFQFAALNFVNPSQNQYRYRLDGFETQWNEIGNRRSATYTRLPPGDYTFEVTASNNDGVWNEQPRSLALTILPPWWLSRPFVGGASVSLLLLLYLAYRARTASLRRQKRLLESQVEERTQNLSQANLQLADRQEEIERQNAELEGHRNRLEELVYERTAQMEEALRLAEDSERLKSAFLANVSHEIRTPMNAIVGFSSLLDDAHIGRDERSEYLAIIRNNADSLTALIDELVEISRIEANQVSSHLRPFDLNLKLQELEQCFAAESKADLKIAFANKDAEQATVLVSDELLFGQIMTSLIGNAVKYTRKGAISFGYRLDEEAVTLHVSDTGIGIPPEEQERIFDRFYKVTRKSEQLYRGLGLGLSITRSLVTLLDGEIWLESTPGVGSTFYVKLPRLSATDPTSATS